MANPTDREKSALHRMEKAQNAEKLAVNNQAVAEEALRKERSSNTANKATVHELRHALEVMQANFWEARAALLQLAAAAHRAKWAFAEEEQDAFDKLHSFDKADKSRG
jgi:hypothetical protein